MNCGTFSLMSTPEDMLETIFITNLIYSQSQKSIETKNMYLKTCLLKMSGQRIEYMPYVLKAEKLPTRPWHLHLYMDIFLKIKFTEYEP